MDTGDGPGISLSLSQVMRTIHELHSFSTNYHTTGRILSSTDLMLIVPLYMGGSSIAPELDLRHASNEFEAMNTRLPRPPSAGKRKN
ncbi:hypothetical protein TNCV_4804291 [Trichonephila clavipes]|nr:hypothetical protein TNCV_4804291 [Trichonephila clavipes]